MEQPVNAATPAVAANELPPVHDNVAPAGVVNANDTVLVSVGTVLPPASWTATTGCVPNAVPPVEFEGCVVKPSITAAPTVTVSGSLLPVAVPAVAVRT